MITKVKGDVVSLSEVQLTRKEFSSKIQNLKEEVVLNNVIHFTFVTLFFLTIFLIAGETIIRFTTDTISDVFGYMLLIEVIVLMIIFFINKNVIRKISNLNFLLTHLKDYLLEINECSELKDVEFLDISKKATFILNDKISFYNARIYVKDKRSTINVIIERATYLRYMSQLNKRLFMTANTNMVKEQ